MKTKYHTARDLLLETKILSAEPQITRVSLYRFFNILQQTKNCSKKHFEFLENVPIIANNTIRKETSKTKFKQKITAELLKGHERVLIHRRVAGFKQIFY